MVPASSPDTEIYHRPVSTPTTCSTSTGSGNAQLPSTYSSLGSIVAACFSVVSYAGYIIGVRKTRAAQVESTALTFLVMAIGAVLFAVAGSLTTGLHAVTEGRTWGNILGLALPATAISNIALVKAIKAIGPTLSSILGALEPLTAVAIGVLYFGEPLTIAGIAGMALVIIAVMIVVIYDGKRPTATTPIPPASEL